MKKINISIIAFTLISFLGMSFVLHKMFAQENDKYSTEGTGKNIKFSPRKSMCVSGFSKLPLRLHEVYRNQIKAFKKSNHYLKYELKNKIDFYGYVYPKAKELVMNKDTLECHSPHSYKEIKFVPPEINSLLKMYVSADIENKLIIQKLKLQMSKSSYTSTEIEMCMSYECGAKKLNGTIKTHNIQSLDQLESVDEFTFSHLYINVLNEIRFKSQSEKYGFYLNDDEISSLMADAGKITISEVKMQLTER